MFSFFAFKKSMKSNVDVLKFWDNNAGHLIFYSSPKRPDKSLRLAFDSDNISFTENFL